MAQMPAQGKRAHRQGLLIRPRIVADSNRRLGLGGQQHGAHRPQ